MKRIAIIGCGWIGERLAPYLSRQGYHVVATTTTPEKIPVLKKNVQEVHLLDFTKNPDFSILANIDVAVFSMPISKTNWYEGFEKLDQEFSKTLLFSSTGIYPQEKKTYTEDDHWNLRHDIYTAENLVKKKYPQTNILRFGGLMGDDRSLKNSKNRKNLDLQKAVNYIHYEDILEIVKLFIQSEIRASVYNIVAPEHPQIGEILQGEKFTKSEIPQRIISSDLFIQDFNYTFKHPNPKYF